MAKRQVAAAAATAPPARVRRGEQRDPSAAAKEMMQEIARNPWLKFKA